MRKIIILIVILVIVFVGIFIFNRPQPNPEPVACTMEAKICPDGSAVGRSGPHCEFAKCPDTAPTTGLENLKYTRALDWPPKVEITNGPFTCTDVKGQIGLPTTEHKIIGNRTYCVTTNSDAAMGSSYKSLTYAAAKSDKVISISFTIQTPNCVNYDEPNKTSCEQEQKAFNPDSLVERIYAAH